jgi:hypothetical protein
MPDETPEEKAAREAQRGEAAVAAEAAKNEKKFTQADLDRHIAERLARDRKDRPSDEEIAELRAAKTKLDELEQANQSELEKAQQRAEAAEKARDDALETAKETTLKAAISRRRRSPTGRSSTRRPCSRSSTGRR